MKGLVHKYKSQHFCFKIIPYPTPETDKSWTVDTQTATDSAESLLNLALRVFHWSSATRKARLLLRNRI